MKRFLTLLASALLVLSFTSCDKEGGDFPPYYKVSKEMRYVSGTSGTSDFSQISAELDKYINTEFASEGQAVSLYKDILSKTKDASYSAPGESYLIMKITKYVSHRENEYTISYEADPSYKSPVSHIWDANGSRDL
ncbi:MAG: hypothetical protein MJY48_00990 [Bacteroidales bacterium]|nr:hypothetical protein [Bacteroidales bacterium]